jgi:hypothetical protein
MAGCRPLVIRIIAGLVLLRQSVLAPKASISIESVIVELFEIALGLLLFVGFGRLLQAS